MMKRETSRIPLLSIAIFCFLVGALSVLINLSNQDNTAEKTAAPPTESDASRKTALILGVDRLNQSDPQLLSVWIATFHFPDKEIVLYGFPTDLQSSASPIPLANSFGWSPDNGVDGNFLAAVQKSTGVEPDVVLILDEVGYASLIDYLEGITLTGNYMDGPTVISALRVFYDDPLISLEAQSKVLRALAERVEILGGSPNLTPLFNLIPEHAYTSESPSVVAVTFGLLLPLRSDAIHIQEWQGSD
ncbi:MAG: hypothetical protein P8Z41_13915 [Anaerolineales bacterium]|jgi:hypothetical protein